MCRFPVSTGFLLTAVLALSMVTGLQAQEHADSRWVTTWATSPSTIPGTEAPLTEADDRTLRLIVHSSAAGSALRLRLSNYHGLVPVQLGAVTIALQDDAHRVQTGSLQQLRFNGQPGVTIARGATVLSDPLEFTVPAATNLSISLHVIEDGDFLTAHALSNQTNYVSAAGNFADSAALSVAEETPAWPLLTAIDVISDANASAIAMVGDSITDGWGSTLSGNQRWPNHFAQRLYQDEAMANHAVVNAGISGNRVTTQDNPTFGQNLQARFQRDVLALSKVSHMVLLEGINDIGMSSMSGELIDAATIIAGYQHLINRAHAAGIRVIGATLTPFEGAVYYSEAGEAVRREVNEFIRDSGEFDGVIDFDETVRDPDNPSRLRPDLTEDNLHPNDAGYKLMAEAVDLDLFR